MRYLFSGFCSILLHGLWAKIRSNTKMKTDISRFFLIKKNAKKRISNSPPPFGIDMYKVLLVYLAYNITSHASLYKVNINDKLISLGLDTKLLDKVPVYLYLLPAPQPSTSLDKKERSFFFLKGYFYE